MVNDFTSNEWQTLALLKAVDEPLSAEFIASVPSEPSELQEVLRKGLESGLVAILHDGGITRVKDL
jgi:hypothetical protein